MEKPEQLKKQPLSKLIFSMSAPAIISLLCNSVNMMIDRMFIAKGVGTLGLSAVTVAFGLSLLMQACSQLIGSGASSATAIQLGEKNYDRAGKIIGNAFLMSFLIAFLISVAGLLFADPLLKLYGADKENIIYAHDYAGIMFGGAICFVLAQSMNSIVRGLGYSKRSLVNFVSGIVINLILDALFVLVFQWGVKGAALATVIGNLVCSVLAIWFLCSKKNVVQSVRRNIKPDKGIMVSILSIGVSGFIGQFSLSLVILVFNHVCEIYGGNTAVASYGIISTVFMLVYMPVIGLGQGIQPIIGYNYGSKMYLRVKETLLKAFQFATVFCIIMFLFFYIFSPQIIAAFGGINDSSLTSIAVKGLRIYGLMTPVVGMQMTGANFFQYIGKVKQSMLLSALRQMILLIPLTIALPIFFGLAGVWSATPVSDGIAFLLTIFFVKSELDNINEYISGKEHFS